MHHSKKIGFWTIIALVTGSQIGSGIFIAPAVMAPYGVLAFFGWALAGIGAISIALVFSKLCSLFPKTGGPHVYAKAAFGDSTSFFVGWTYWVISWVSSIAVIKASVGYLLPVIGDYGMYANLALEIGLLSAISLLNSRGINFVSTVEILITAMKMIPLILVPLLALGVFNVNNFTGETSFVRDSGLFENLGKVIALAIWGFVGMELATTPAESVLNPQKTIPRAIVVGTTIVAAVYLLNNMAISGSIPNDELVKSTAPYVDFVEKNFGGNWGTIVSLITSIVCISTLNAWVLSAGQVGLGLSNDKLFPKILGTKNKFGAPFFSIVASAIFSIPILFLTYKPNLASEVALVIDFSVTAFLFVYVISIVALLKILIERKELRILHCTYCAVALFFCIWMLCSTDFTTLLIALSFAIIGIPVYIWQRLYSKNSIWASRRIHIARSHK